MRGETDSVPTQFYKSLKVNTLLFAREKQEKANLFFPNKIPNFANVEVSLNLINVLKSL